jgi:hypothetical protein
MLYNDCEDELEWFASIENRKQIKFYPLDSSGARF